MKKIYKLLFILCVAFSFTQTANAGNIAGGNITYRAIDSVTYEVTARIYAFCDTVPYTPDSTLTVSWQGNTYNTVMTLMSITDVTGTFYKCSVTTDCNSGTFKGINEFLFKDTVNLVGSACKVTFGWQSGTRHANITTGAANTGIYIFAETNTCYGLNSSIHPTLPPQFIAPVGQDLSLNCGYIDTIDGDSMGFRLVSPQSAPGTAIGYSGSWSALRPISFLGFPNVGLNTPAGLRLDSTNAALSFRPTKQSEISVICIETYEFRRVNGQMVEIGRTRMDKVLIVMPSPNNKTKTPKIKPPFGASVCLGSTVCFDIETDDPDASDTTYLISNEGIKGATFTPNRTGRFAGGTFCWTPTQADVRNWPHFFTVRVRDDGCSPNGMTTRVFGIMVYGEPDSSYLEVEKTALACGHFKVKMKQPATSTAKRKFTLPAGKVKYASQDSFEVEFDSSGWYYYTNTVTFNNACSITQTDSVQVLIPYTLQLATTPDTAVCPNDTFTLRALPQNGIAPYTYLWLPQNISAPQLTDVLKQAKKYTLTTIDSLGCVAFDTVNVSVHSLQKIHFSVKDSVCKTGSPFVLTANPPNGNWSLINSAVILPDTFIPANADTGTNKLYYTANDSNSCIVNDSTSLYVVPEPVPNCVLLEVLGAPYYSAKISFWATPKADAWIWQFERAGAPYGSQIITYNDSFPLSMQFNDTGVFSLTLTAILGQCSSTITKKDYIKIGPLSGIGDVSNSEITLYANPLQKGSILVIEGELLNTVSMYDALGRKMEISIEKINENKMLVNTSQLIPGMYWLTAFVENTGVSTFKVVINP